MPKALDWAQCTAVREVNNLKLMGQSQSPYIVEMLYWNFSPRGSLAIVFEEMDGDLHTFHSEDKISNEATLMHIMVSILRGLRDMHNEGIYHRDLKPQNILVKTTPDGQLVVKIADLGASKHGEALNWTHTGVCTVPFCPPELLTHDRAFFVPDNRTWDVYSAGVVFTGLLNVEKVPIMVPTTIATTVPIIATAPLSITNEIGQLQHILELSGIVDILEFSMGKPTSKSKVAADNKVLQASLCEFYATKKCQGLLDERRQQQVCQLLANDMLSIYPTSRRAAVELLAHPFFSGTES